MEYAMCTLITGNRTPGSLVGVTAHEFAHSWFQHILASNESKHEWMDEGFTSYISDLAMEAVQPKKVKEGEEPESPFQGAYDNYFYLVKTGKEQPLTTHADRYDTSTAYGIAAYSKGELFLAQLGYIIGQDKLAETLKRYYYDYKFSHPTPNDIKRSAERVSGAILDWYLVDWCQTTNTVDYAIKGLAEAGNTTKVTLESLYIPLAEMHYIKDNPYPNLKRTVLPDWDWAHPTYEFTLPKAKAAIKVLVIDAAEIMADVNKADNEYIKEK
jgi:aminopeptidase N